MAQFFERWDWPENACQYHLPRRERSTPGGSLSPSPVSSIYFNMWGRLFALWRTTAGEGKVIVLGELQACVLQSYTWTCVSALYWVSSLVSQGQYSVLCLVTGSGSPGSGWKPFTALITWSCLNWRFRSWTWDLLHALVPGVAWWVGCQTRISVDWLWIPHSATKTHQVTLGSS